MGGTAVESNVYREQFIGAENVGETWTFQFDAKRGDIGGDSTAAAFIKTVDLSTPDPNGEFLVTNFITVDTTSTSPLWSSYAINIFIDAGLVGQVLQFGFLNVATNFQPTGIVYDNVDFSLVPLPAAVWLFASGVAGLFGFRRLSGGS